jgi:molybdopterin-containing oxidoreductase family iron-sulfur binding subunit
VSIGTDEKMDKQKELKSEAVCPSKPELAEVRDKLSRAKSGPQYWRSLEELAQTDGFMEMVHREFPRLASVWPEGASRRDFMKLMTASMALAGLSACVKQPIEPIVPYVRQPEPITLGIPLYFASAMPLAGYATPVLVENHEGRPTKVEGNPDHPAGVGSDVFAQASILDMYDPDRSQSVTYTGFIRSWSDFTTALQGPLNSQKAVQGAGLRVLTRTVSSPTLADQLSTLTKQYPQAKWVQYDPVGRDNVRAGAQMAFGQYVETHYNFDKAEIVLSLDGDFLSSGYPGFVLYARQFASRRNPELKEKMSRFYIVESSPTNTGGKADHRLPVRASEVEGVARAIAAGLGAGSGSAKPEQQAFVAALVKDLQAHKGSALVIAGDNQPPAVHALAHAMNAALGAVGTTVYYTDPVEAKPQDQGAALKELVGDMNAGKVDLLVIIGGNPVYDAPADLKFADAMGKVQLRVQHSLFQDETTDYVHWHINATHYLEQWGDVRTIDGTATLIQPLIAPLYEGKSEYELVEALNGASTTTGYEIVRRYWQQKMTGDFEAEWRKALNDGFVAGTAVAAKTVSAKGMVNPTLSSAGAADKGGAPAGSGALEVMFRRDATIYDGTFSNNAWLQETPKSMTQICWDNAIQMSVKTAEKLGLQTEDIVEIDVNGRKVKGGLWRTPGHPDDAMTVFLGYGRTKCGRVGTGVGFNAYELRTSDAMYFAGGKVTKAGSGYGFANPQGWQYIDQSGIPGAEDMRDRHIVRKATLDDFMKHPEFAKEEGEAPSPEFSLYTTSKGLPLYQYTEAKWGMAIDMNSCVGCKTCVVACQAENNIPVVGKEQVMRGRHMNWLRVDVYYEGGTDNPSAYYQPIPCQQCENAPCEVVCPVGATVHSTEGLNDMVYNRCVGTRYCSNNCPYKVRRFNFLLWQDWDTPQYKMMRNPEVSVRSRGVMEKCTYCIQRITHGRITAERENRAVKDGEIQTACQQACPAGAIVFGDLNDKNSRVAKLRADGRNYGILEDLNTRPRTTYMAVVTNPNPELEKPERS